MEKTIVYYHDYLSAMQEFHGPWSSVAGGIILHRSSRSSLFIPYGQIVCIEQDFTADVDSQEIYNKSLYQRLRSR